MDRVVVVAVPAVEGNSGDKASLLRWTVSGDFASSWVRLRCRRDIGDYNSASRPFRCFAAVAVVVEVRRNSVWEAAAVERVGSTELDL